MFTSLWWSSWWSLWLGKVLCFLLSPFSLVFHQSSNYRQVFATSFCSRASCVCHGGHHDGHQPTQAFLFHEFFRPYFKSKFLLHCWNYSRYRLLQYIIYVVVIVVVIVAIDIYMLHVSFFFSSHFFFLFC